MYNKIEENKVSAAEITDFRIKITYSITDKPEAKKIKINGVRAKMLLRMRRIAERRRHDNGALSLSQKRISAADERILSEQRKRVM